MYPEKTLQNAGCFSTDQLFARYISAKQRMVKASTAETYKYIYNTHIRPEIGAVPLNELHPADMQAILDSMSDENYASATIGLTAAILTSMFSYACRCEIISRSPAILDIPRGRCRKSKTVFTLEQQGIYLRYTAASPLAPLFHLALYTGMRQGELCALQWQDVDLQNKTIHVRHTIHHQAGESILTTPKTPSSVRDIPLLPQAAATLERLARAGDHSPEDFVFTINGDTVRKGQISREITRVLARINADHPDFPAFTMHTTRHTFATRCIEAGMTPKVLQKLLGHSSLSVTMDTYVSILDAEKQRQMNMVSSAFGLPPTE